MVERSLRGLRLHFPPAQFAESKETYKHGEREPERNRDLGDKCSDIPLRRPANARSMGVATYIPNQRRIGRIQPVSADFVPVVQLAFVQPEFSNRPIVAIRRFYDLALDGKARHQRSHERAGK